MVDMAILPLKPRSNDSWPYKGIFIEFDGPSHYYCPPGPNGELYHSAFSKHRVKILENLGYKVFILPFYSQYSSRQLNVFEPNTTNHGLNFDQDKMI